MRIRPVADYPRTAARRAARRGPAGVDDPTVVVLTPGVYNGAYFEHTLLARMMGVELVEGRDLLCSGGRVLDAHHPRASSRSTSSTAASTTSSSTRCTSAPTRCSACPGLINARPRRQRHDRQRGRQRRRRRQADLHLRARPDPLLPRRGADPAPTSTPGGSTSRTPSRGGARPARRAGGQAGRRLRRQGPRDRPGGRRRRRSTRCASGCSPTRAAGSPSRWSSCRPCRRSSTARLAPAARRPAAVRGQRRRRVWVLPGGLTRVALPEGELVVNSSQGGGSKDTWVARRRHGQRRPPRHGRPGTAEIGRHDRARPRSTRTDARAPAAATAATAAGRSERRGGPSRDGVTPC